MAEITVNNLQKYFGERHVLRGLSFELHPGERAGIVGPNGCGKTTLFKIIAGLEPYDGGDVVIPKDHRVGLLEQIPDYDPALTVRDVLWQAFAPIEQMGEQMRALEQRMAEAAPACLPPADLARYARLQTAFETAGGYDLSVPYNIMTGGLRISADMQQRPFMRLSGGEKTRVNLARLMLAGTDILLLDEPTNHLDLESIAWLEDYLRSFKGAALIVSHDRYFLDRATSRTLEMEEGKLTSFPGNYSYYVDKKQELVEQLEARKKRQDKEIERLSFTVERMKGWGLGNKKVMRRAFAMEKRLQRIERIETVRKQRKLGAKFTQAAQSGDEVYHIEKLSAGYGAPLVSDLTALVLRGERIAVLGPNGCGKTTLVQTILGLLPPLAGAVHPGAGLRCGYLPQTVTFDHPERTVLDTMLYETRLNTQQSRDRLASFAFTGEDVFKQVATLSGGEKTRLKLCIFMDTGVNTLFLDEPTNHLDILSREWIEDAIDDFSETMLFVSHDRYFINRFATRIWMVENGHITDFLGTYDQFLAAQARAAAQQKGASKTGGNTAASARNPAPSGNAASANPTSPSGSPASSTSAAAASAPCAKRPNQKELEKRRRQNERRIAQLEQQLEQIDQEMAASPDDYLRLQELVGQKDAAELELLALYEENEG